MGFTSPAEVVKYIGGIFEAAFEDDELAPRLRETGVVLKFALTDPDTVLVVDAPRGLVQEGDDDVTVGATMTMAADVANAYWQGKENLPLAMAKGRIKVSGEIAALLRLAPLAKKLYPVYVDRLRRDGRDDLLVE
jgi:hypothetical protein